MKKTLSTITLITGLFLLSQAQSQQLKMPAITSPDTVMYKGVTWLYGTQHKGLSGDSDVYSITFMPSPNPLSERGSIYRCVLHSSTLPHQDSVIKNDIVQYLKNTPH